MSIQEQVAAAKAERDSLIAQVAAKKNISTEQVKQQLSSGSVSDPSSAASEENLNRHLIYAQIPVLNQAEQIKLAASSGATSGKEILQNGVNAMEGADEKIDLDTYRRMRYQFGTNLKAYGDSSLKNGLSEGSSSAQSGSSSAGQTFGAMSTHISQNLKPVSSFVGSTLGTMTGVSTNPVGTLNDFPNALGQLMDKTNPRLRSKLEMSLQKFNIDKLAETPKSLVASVEQFAQSLKGLVATPMRMVTDLYYGVMGLLGKIDTFVNSLFNNVQIFVNNVLDVAFPGLMSFLGSLLNFGGKIGGLMGSFGVNNLLGGAMSQATSFASGIGKFTANPTTLLFSNLPDGISKGMYNFQDPQALMQKFMPPKFGSFLNNAGSISGFGRGGNMGLGFGQVLGGMKAGILHGVMDSFGSQLSIISPMLNRTMSDIQSHDYVTEQMSLIGGTSYNVSAVGDRILNQPRTRVNRAITQDLSDPIVSPMVNYFSQNKLEQQAGNAKVLSPGSNQPTVDTGGGMSQKEVDDYIAKNNPAASKQLAAMRADQAAYRAKVDAHIAAAGGL